MSTYYNISSHQYVDDKIRHIFRSPEYRDQITTLLREIGVPHRNIIVTYNERPRAIRERDLYELSNDEVFYILGRMYQLNGGKREDVKTREHTAVEGLLSLSKRD